MGNDVLDDVARQTWATPKDFYSVIDAEFHPTIDVAASAHNAKCAQFISEEVDSLGDVQWLGPSPFGVAWCNPGFNNMLPWLMKAREQANKYDGMVLVLGLVAPSAHWWREGALLANEIRLIGGRRIQFDPAPGINRSSNARENALFIFDGLRPKPLRGPLIWTWSWTNGLPAKRRL